jgi:glycosyltransferase involved in cell wall biosynthesis
VFWPAADPAVFFPRPRNDVLRAELGIAPDECVLTYHGNTHGSNHREVRGLYLAVALLRRSGTPARLIRLGMDCFTETYRPAVGYAEWAAEFTLNLGYVGDRRRIADILACADVFVQPGTADPFNDYRFPSKLPEFFAFGRPVVLPRTNIGLVARHGIDAYVLDRADGPGIAAAVAALWADPALAEQLSAGAVAFAGTHFCWSRAAERLAAFYTDLLAEMPASRAA